MGIYPETIDLKPQYPSVWLFSSPNSKSGRSSSRSVSLLAQVTTACRQCRRQHCSQIAGPLDCHPQSCLLQSSRAEATRIYHMAVRRSPGNIWAKLAVTESYPACPCHFPFKSQVRATSSHYSSAHSSACSPANPRVWCTGVQRLPFSHTSPAADSTGVHTEDPTQANPA